MKNFFKQENKDSKTQEISESSIMSFSQFINESKKVVNNQAMKDILCQEDWLNKYEDKLLNLSTLTQDEDDEDQTIFSVDNKDHLLFVKSYMNKSLNKVWTIKEGIPDKYLDDYKLPEDNSEYHADWFVYKGFETGGSVIGYYLTN